MQWASPTLRHLVARGAALTACLDHAGGGRMMAPLVVTVCADKGGVGKSTISVNFAAEAALRGLRVLAIDADKQADLTQLLGVTPYPGIGCDAIFVQWPTPAADPHIIRVREHLDLLGAWPTMSKADEVLSLRAGSEHALEAALRDVMERYDLIVIDVGHSTRILDNALVLADMLLLPTTPNHLDVVHVVNMIEAVDIRRAELGRPSLRTPGRLVISLRRRTSNSGMEETIMSHLHDAFAQVLAPVVIPFTVRVQEAAVFGLTVREYRDQHCRAARDFRPLHQAVEAYAALADHILGLRQAAAA